MSNAAPNVEVSAKDLMALSVGDVVEAPSMMASLSSEPTLMLVTSASPELVEFCISYFGAVIAIAELTNNQGEFSWAYKRV